MVINAELRNQMQASALRATQQLQSLSQSATAKFMKLASSPAQNTGATANSTATTGNTATASSPSTTVSLSAGALVASRRMETVEAQFAANAQATSATSAIQSTRATANSTATTGNTATASSPPSTITSISDEGRVRLDARIARAHEPYVSLRARYTADTQALTQANQQDQNVLTQAGTQVLAQANQQAQGVLGLLR